MFDAGFSLLASWLQHFSVLHTLAGLLVGLLVGMTGVGGGSLMTPLLTLLFGVSPSVAVGTDLAFAAVTKSVGTLTHRAHGHVQWHIVGWLSLGSLPAALITLYVLSHFGAANPAQIQLIKHAIAFSVALTVLALLYRKRLLAWLAAHPELQLKGRKLVLVTISVGALIGALVTISSIGAGAVGATLILLLYPHLQPREVAGTDIAYAVPLTALAAAGHVWLGTVDWALLATLLLGSVPGIAIGTQLSRHLPENMVRHTLALVLGAVAFKLVF